MDSFTALSIAFFAKEEETEVPVSESGGGSGGLCVVAARDVDVQPPTNQGGGGSGGLCIIA